jgi:hypothetical protein
VWHKAFHAGRDHKHDLVERFPHARLAQAGKKHVTVDAQVLAWHRFGEGMRQPELTPDGLAVAVTACRRGRVEQGIDL